MSQLQGCYPMTRDVGGGGGEERLHNDTGYIYVCNIAQDEG